MHMPYVLTKYIYQGVRNQKSQKWTVPLHPLMHKAQCGPSALNIIHQNMTEIGSFENQTVMKTHVFGIFKGGQYFWQCNTKLLYAIRILWQSHNIMNIW